MLFISVLVVMIIIDLVMFASDRYMVSAMWSISMALAAWFVFPIVPATVMAYGAIQVALGYVGIGAVVSVLKWIATLVRHSMRIRKAKNEFNAKMPNDGTKDEAHRQFEFAKHWNGTVLYQGIPESICPRIGYGETSNLASAPFANPNYLIDSLMIKASNNIDRIGSWVVNWPIVLVATVLDDLLLNIGRNIATLADWVFATISRKFISSAVKGL